MPPALHPVLDPHQTPRHPERPDSPPLDTVEGSGVPVLVEQQNIQLGVYQPVGGAKSPLWVPAVLFHSS